MLLLLALLSLLLLLPLCDAYLGLQQHALLILLLLLLLGFMLRLHLQDKFQRCRGS